MRIRQWLLLSAVAFLFSFPIQNARAVIVSGTASFADTGPTGNGLNFLGTFNPTNAFSFNLTNSSSVTLTNFLTITALDTNFDFLNTATDTISTTFNFLQPTSASGSVNGVGVDTSLLFVLDHGNIHWNGPATVDFGNGLDLTIALSDASFFSVLGNPRVGIDATFSLTGAGSAVSPTPLPAALPLFATGMGGIGLLAWWRKRRQRRVSPAIG